MVFTHEKNQIKEYVQSAQKTTSPTMKIQINRISAKWIEYKIIENFSYIRS